MNNEQLEKEVQKKTGSSKIVFAVLGILVLGIVSLMVGIRIFSGLSISADTLPPIPGDPSQADTSSITPTATSSAVGSPVVPPDPVGPPIEVTFPSGWSVVSGSTLYGYDMAPITKQGIFAYSFNDPYLPNRNWIISNDPCANQSDYFCLNSSSVKFSPYPNMGYYVYNPGSQVKLSLYQVTSHTLNTKNAIFGRGWHLMHWGGSASDKNELLSSLSITYSDNSSLKVLDAIKADIHKASIKVYVIMDTTDIDSSSVKELTGKDSATTLSKIPQDSYFWVYLRRTQLRAVGLGAHQVTPNVSVPSATATGTPSTPLIPPIPTAP